MQIFYPKTALWDLLNRLQAIQNETVKVDIRTIQGVSIIKDHPAEHHARMALFDELGGYKDQCVALLETEGFSVNFTQKWIQTSRGLVIF